MKSERSATDEIDTSRFLVLSALGADRPGIVNELAKVAVNHDCNIEDSRMTVMGGEFAILMLISGTENHIDAFDNDILVESRDLGLKIITRRTQQKRLTHHATPYQVTVTALDNRGIIHEIAGFFSKQGMNIEDMKTGTYRAPHTGSTMFSLVMTVNIPTSTAIPALHESFTEFCDEHNLDGVMESRT